MSAEQIVHILADRAEAALNAGDLHGARDLLERARPYYSQLGWPTPPPEAVHWAAADSATSAPVSPGCGLPTWQEEVHMDIRDSWTED